LIIANSKLAFKTEKKEQRGRIVIANKRTGLLKTKRKKISSRIQFIIANDAEPAFQKIKRRKSVQQNFS